MLQEICVRNDVINVFFLLQILFNTIIIKFEFTYVFFLKKTNPYGELRVLRQSRRKLYMVIEKPLWIIEMAFDKREERIN
jgi:hypothetical protein